MGSHLAATEEWNNTSWTAVANMSTGRSFLSGAGTTTAGLAFGGNVPGYTAATEEWLGAGQPVGAWSTGGSLNTARNLLSRAGVQTSALTFGGGGAGALTEKYNGSTWTEVNDLNLGRNTIGGFGATGDSAIAAGGYSGTAKTETESWNGTNWTEVNNLNRVTASAVGIGNCNIWFSCWKI